MLDRLAVTARKKNRDIRLDRILQDYLRYMTDFDAEREPVRPTARQLPDTDPAPRAPIPTPALPIRAPRLTPSAPARRRPSQTGTGRR